MTMRRVVRWGKELSMMMTTKTTMEKRQLKYEFDIHHDVTMIATPIICLSIAPLRGNSGYNCVAGGRWLGHDEIEFVAYRGCCSIMEPLAYEERKVFDSISESSDKLLFNTKMRALVWIKASMRGLTINAEGWLSKPFDCCFELQPDSLLGRGVVEECYVPKMGVIGALFFGPTRAKGRDLAELFSVKTALEIFIKAGWVGVVKLVVESNSSVLLNWIENPLALPREGWSCLLDIDKASNLIGNICFRFVESDDNAMVSLLAMEGTNRGGVFSAWWK
ncbi:hypothetical protein GQ457_14G013010 [Hibiscus cannabinus]